MSNDSEPRTIAQIKADGHKIVTRSGATIIITTKAETKTYWVRRGRGKWYRFDKRKF